MKASTYKPEQLDSGWLAGAMKVAKLKQVDSVSFSADGACTLHDGDDAFTIGDIQDVADVLAKPETSEKVAA